MISNVFGKELVMETPISIRSKAYAACREKFACEHEHKSIRLRIVDKGIKQYVYQCMRCGQPTSSAIKMKEAIRLNEGVNPSQFDVALMTAWDSEKKNSYERIETEYQGRISQASSSEGVSGEDEWSVEYAGYLQSDN